MNAKIVQILVTLVVSVMIFTTAFAIVWPSYALRMLKSEDSPLGYRITDSDENLIGSVVMLGCVVSILVAGYVNDKIGRKTTMILIGVCRALGWCIIATAKSVTQLVIGRLVLGIALGLEAVTEYIVIFEISEAAMTGTLFILLCCVFNIGALVSYIAGWFCSYEVIIYINLAIMFVFVMVVALILKETPYYLMSNGKEHEALLSLKFYRGAKTVNQDIKRELAYMWHLQQACSSDRSGFLSEREKLNKPSSPTSSWKLLRFLSEREKLNKPSSPTSSWKLLLTSKASQRVIILSTIQTVLCVSVGLIGIQTYAGPMFLRAVPTLSPDLCSVIFAVVLTIAGLAAVFVIARVPRRTLLISLCLSTSACMVVLASLVRWSWAPEWAIPVVVLVYCTCFQLGVGNIPILQAGECVPPQLKSFCSVTAMFSMYCTNFVILLLFQPAISVFGLDGVFLIFAILGVLSAAVAYLFMRETKDVPFDIVHNSFSQGYLYRSLKII